MTTPRELRRHRAHQRRLMASGIIPPRACSRPFDCRACGTTFTPTTEGVVRWWSDAGPLWLSSCPTCQSHQTVYSRLRREA